MSVTGTLSAPCIGILDNALQGQELLDCPLHVPVINQTLRKIKALIEPFKLVPYDIASRRGELKGLILKASADGGSVMVRFVLRSTEAVVRVKKASVELMAAVPEVTTVSVNIQPVPHAILEGETEIIVAGAPVLTEKYNFIDLVFNPQSFAQVTPETAAALYAYVTERIAALRPDSVLDLYCGVGGFSLHAAAHTTLVRGIELSSQAIECARLGAERNGITNIEFHASPVDAFVRTVSSKPGAIICNPPRRGLGPAVCESLNKIQSPHIFYSSCNPETLFRDLESLNAYRSLRLAPFEMFPLTEHFEVIAELAIIE